MRTVIKWVSTIVVSTVMIAVVVFLLYSLAKAAWVTPTIISTIASWVVFVAGSILVVGVLVTILIILGVEAKHKLQEPLPLSSLHTQKVSQQMPGQSSTSPRLSTTSSHMPNMSIDIEHAGQLIDMSNSRLMSLKAIWDDMVKKGMVAPGLSQEQIVNLFLQACLAHSVQVSIRQVAGITGVPRSSVGVTKSWLAYANKQPLPKV